MLLEPLARASVVSSIVVPVGSSPKPEAATALLDVPLVLELAAHCCRSVVRRSHIAGRNCR